MATQNDSLLYEGAASPKDIILRTLQATVVATTVIYLFAGAASPTDIILRAPSVAPEAPGGFPTQYAGLRTYYHAAVQELCLVAEADGATGMGGIPMVSKNGVTYAIYLVETTDPNASLVRIEAGLGIKAIRLKT
jgi:hypothetical protein